MSTLKFSPASRDRLFYDVYEYGICVSLEEAGCLRAKTPTELSKTIQYRNRARGLWDKHKPMIEGRVLQNLLWMFDELDRVRDQIKVVISYNILYIYSNDTAVLQHLANLTYIGFNSSVQAVLDKPRDVVLQTDPKFKLRSYFRDRMMSDHDCDVLARFLEQRREDFGVTNYFLSKLRRRRIHWVQRHNFVDHNDIKDITMLSLVLPGVIRKTLPIQAK